MADWKPRTPAEVEAEELNWMNPQSVRATWEAPGYMTRTIEVVGDDGRKIQVKVANAELVALAEALLETIKEESGRVMGHPLDWPDFDRVRDLPALVRRGIQ